MIFEVEIGSKNIWMGDYSSLTNGLDFETTKAILT